MDRAKYRNLVILVMLVLVLIQTPKIASSFLGNQASLCVFRRTVSLNSPMEVILQVTEEVDSTSNRQDASQPSVEDCLTSANGEMADSSGGARMSGVFYLLSNQPVRGGQLLERHLQSHPRDQVARFFLALSFWSQGYYKRAAADWESVGADHYLLGPMWVFIEKGDTLSKEGDLDSARRQYVWASQLVPSSGIPFYYLGTNLLAMGKRAVVPAAVEYLRKSATLGSGNTRIDAATRYWLGVALIESGDPVNGLNILREATILAPDQVLYRRQLADELFRLGRCTEAGEQYRALLSLAPQDAVSTERLASILRGECSGPH